MSFSPKIMSYIEEKIGHEYLAGFALWALVGMNSPKQIKASDSFIDTWNMTHRRNPLRKSMNAFDAVDRMIEIWMERFK